MKLIQPTAEIYVQEGMDHTQALARTTHLAISAHQDDVEIMAAEPILTCFQQPDLWFGAVILTDGRGSPRTGLYSSYSDGEMCTVRRKEQRKAAFVGEYSILVQLNYPSAIVKESKNKNPVNDLKTLLTHMHPRFVYTHNLADKHDTHVSTSLRVIEAIRGLPIKTRPEKLYGCEVWRSLDWLLDEDKVIFELSDHENLQASLLGVFDSQITGGKRYDLATLGRRKENATFFESHELDASTGISFGIDLTPLIQNETLAVEDFILAKIDAFKKDVNDRITRNC
jgi:LmbE family N-acetylglucosaminyl deacetylase